MAYFPASCDYDCKNCPQNYKPGGTRYRTIDDPGGVESGISPFPNTHNLERRGNNEVRRTRMDISEIRRITELLKRANCTSFALVSEIAKEMGVKKTTLMQFIEDNPKLFRLGEAFKHTKTTKTSLGLSVITAYLTAEENPDTEEWMEKMKKEWENKIHVGEQTYYGCHEYWLIPEDDPKSDNDTYRKMGLYRNTPEKIQFLVEKGIIKKVSGGYGGLSDYYRTEYYPYGDKVQKALEDIGWTTDFILKEDKQ